MPTTTEMELDLPTPEVTTGPTWAEQLNTALTTLDTHDHSEGKGSRITPAGMTINDDIEMNDNAVTEAKAVSFEAQSTATGIESGSVYRKDGNLWWKNGAGTEVQVTSGSSVNASGTGTITLDTPASFPYSVVSGDAQKVLAIDTSAARTLNLPAATTAMFVMVKDKTGSAQTNNITVAPNGTDTIEGVNASWVISTNRASVGFISDGVSAWYVV
jgi:hypothetical protein